MLIRPGRLLGGRRHSYGTGGGVSIIPPSAAVAARSNPPEVALAGWEAWMGRQTGGLIAFIEASSWAGLVSVANQQSAIQGAAGRTIKWASGIPVGETLANAAAGSGDASYIAIAAAILAASPGTDPIDWRLGWEMNLFPGYYPWSAFTGAAGTAGTVIAAYVTWWRRIADLLHGISPRFRIHWTPNSYFAASDPELVYPGDAYVDVIGMDAYLIKSLDIDTNGGSGPEGKMLGATDFKFTGGGRSLDWVKTFAATHSKPIALDEFGVNLDDAEYWVARVAAWARASNVVEIGYWDQNNTGDNAADAQNKLSAGQYPATGAQFLREFGPFTIDTPAAHNASNSQTTIIPLVASRPIKEWRLISAPAGYSLVGASIVIQPSAPSGSVLVQAVDYFAPSITKTLTVTKVASLSAWTMAAFGSSLAIWYDVSDAATITQSGGLCSALADKSGNSRNASQANGTKQPAYSLTGRNSLPALTGDGVDDFMALANVSGLPDAASALTIVGAFYGAAGGNTGSRYIYGQSSAAFAIHGRLGAVSGTLRHFRSGQNNTKVSTVDKDLIVVAHTPIDVNAGLAPSRVRVDGVEYPAQAVTVGAAGAVGAARIFTRPDASDYWMGSMHELAVLNREPTSYESALIEGYLAAKWAGQSRLPASNAFKSAAPLITT